jgi:hypothetical protein
MPPELIVTSAQGHVTGVDSNETQADGAATTKLQHQHMEKTRQHRPSQMYVGYIDHLLVHKLYVILSVQKENVFEVKNVTAVE